MTFKPIDKSFDPINNAFRLRTKGIITGPELVDKVLANLAHDGDFERVADVTMRLMEQDSASVSDWLKWAEERCNDPQWIPFHLDTRNGATEFDRNMSGNFRRVADLVQSIIKDHRPEPES